MTEVLGEVCIPELGEHLLSHGFCLSNLCSCVIQKPTSPFIVKISVDALGSRQQHERGSGPECE